MELDDPASIERQDSVPSGQRCLAVGRMVGFVWGRL